MNETVHCLICDGIYKEYRTLILKCPHCGNDDLKNTVYLIKEVKKCSIYYKFIKWFRIKIYL
jgi:hypothetical protein